MNILRQISIKLWILIFLGFFIVCINYVYSYYLLSFVKWAHNSVGNPLSGEFNFAETINLTMILLSIALLTLSGIIFIINGRKINSIPVLQNRIIIYLVLSLLLLFSYISLISSISASITNGQIYRVNGILMNTVK